MPRRRLLIASATTLPLLFTNAGCSSADLFAGPDPLGSAPPLAHDTVVLQTTIAAEQRLIALYESVLSGSHTQRSGGAAGESASASGHGVLSSLLAQHQRHLAELKGRLVIPPGAPASASGSPAPSPSASGSPASSPSAGAGGASPIALLRAAERASAATLVRQLATVEPALAQLFASIAASDATHVIALASVGG